MLVYIKLKKIALLSVSRRRPRLRKILNIDKKNPDMACILEIVSASAISPFNFFFTPHRQRENSTDNTTRRYREKRAWTVIWPENIAQPLSNDGQPVIAQMREVAILE